MSRRDSVRHAAPIGATKTYCGQRKTPEAVTGGTRPCQRSLAAKRRRPRQSGNRT